MLEKQRFVSLAGTGKFTVTELCAEGKISRKTGYKWLRRYCAEGVAGLRDRSRRPRGCAHQTAVQIEQLILREPKNGVVSRKMGSGFHCYNFICSRGSLKGRSGGNRTSLAARYYFFARIKYMLMYFIVPIDAAAVIRTRRMAVAVSRDCDLRRRTLSAAIVWILCCAENDVSEGLREVKGNRLSIVSSVLCVVSTDN